MENNNLESISDSILKSLIYDILNMKTIDFVTCIITSDSHITSNRLNMILENFYEKL